jgi:ferredoxin
MAFMITDDCINCGHCAKECPNQAIYEPGAEWTLADGTNLQQSLEVFAGIRVGLHKEQGPLSDRFHFVVPEKCSECRGAYEVPQCQYVCPNPGSFVIHPDYKEKISELLIRQYLLNPAVPVQ